MKNKFKYTADHLLYLDIAYQMMTVEDLTAAFNAQFRLKKTVAAIKTALKTHGIRCGRPYGKRLINRFRMLTPGQVQFLRDNYKGRRLREMAEVFNAHFKTAFTIGQIRTAIKNRGITSGWTGRFPKGITPWNSGTKGLTGRNKTSFKKGNVPPNRKPLWTERITRDGYIEIKVPQRNPYTGHATRYVLKHVYLYEKEFGPAPDGHVVIFLDGNQQNCEPKNLATVHRLELLRLNKLGYKAAPAEVKPSVLALARLEATTFTRRNYMMPAKMSPEIFDAAVGKTRHEAPALAIGRDRLVKGLSLAETARRHGVLPARVRQIEERIFRAAGRS